jgi:hypothetical protein
MTDTMSSVETDSVFNENLKKIDTEKATTIDDHHDHEHEYEDIPEGMVQVRFTVKK